MKKPDLAIVFGKGGDHPADDNVEEPTEGKDDDNDPEMDDALNSAIDDLFAAKDPEARREAFKTAVNMCKDSSY
jgi:hypothetical protein